LYGLKQAPRAWYDRLSKFLLHNGFVKGKVDTTLLIKKENKNFLLVQIYVDDIIFGSSNESLCKKFSKSMQDEFEMSMMGELTFFLGLQVKQMKEGTFIHQEKYANDLVKRFGLEKCKKIDIPMSCSQKIDKDEEGKKVDQKLYRSMIGSLLYLTASRPDILFSVCICARFQSDPRESHLIAVKRIIKYVASSSSIGLWYPKRGDFNLLGYSDADLAGCRVDRKSTSGTCQLLGNRTVSWFSRKQSTVALSTTEAEYVALGSCCSQILWIKQQLQDFGIEDSCTEIRCDNTSAINLTKNPILHSRAKHIEIRHHFIRDHIQNGEISIQFVDSKSQLADIFTKPLEKNQFDFIRSRLNILKLEEVKV